MPRILTTWSTSALKLKGSSMARSLDTFLGCASLPAMWSLASSLQAKATQFILHRWGRNRCRCTSHPCHLVNQCLEAEGLLNGQVAQHFPVKLDVLLLQPMDESGICQLHGDTDEVMLLQNSHLSGLGLPTLAAAVTQCYAFCV